MDFNKVKETTLVYLKKGKDMAIDVTEKGKVEVLVLNNKAKLYRAQRQLGALVYSLAKGHEENQPLVDKYIAAIATIEENIESLKASLTPEEKAEVEAAEAAAAPAEYVVVEDAEAPAQPETAESAVAEETVQEPVAEEEKPADVQGE